jgi:catechol 2,3-dioxygenase-like lactoylglutathione lyase family enzyme
VSGAREDITAAGNSPAPVVGAAVLTHGTLEDRVLASARLLYEKVLGLRCVQHSPQSQLIAGRSGFGIVAVEAGTTAHPQGRENRWLVHAGDSAAVRAAHHRASDASKELGIQSIAPIAEAEADVVAFALQDADGNWWEITSRSPSHYQALFAKGDVGVPHLKSQEQA